LKEIRQFKKVSLNDLDAVSYEVSEFLESPCVLFLKGDVGAGKTTFVQHFLNVVCNGLQTTSPTYAIVHEIDRVLHGDLYRLESCHELIPLELELLMEDKDYVFLEWPDQFESDLINMIDDNFSLYQLDFSIDKLENYLRDISFLKL